MPKNEPKQLDSDALEAIARVLHEANRAWCMANGDDSQPSWDDAEDWMREATFAAIQFRLENPDAGPEAQHDQWASQKRADGWVHGDVKDASKKTHPMLVPFADLPDREKRKDHLFVAIIAALTKPID